MKVYKKTVSETAESSLVKVLDDLIIADNFINRLTGLMVRPRLLSGQGLLITGCNSIHTLWLRYSIDVIFLDKGNRIVEIIEDLKPFRFTKIIRPAVSVLEMLSSSVVGHGLKLNDILVFYWYSIDRKKPCLDPEGSEVVKKVSGIKDLVNMPDEEKMTMGSRISCIFLCNLSGKIRQKIYDGPGLLKGFEKDGNFFALFNKENKEKSIRFLDDIILKGITIDWELNVDHDGLIKKYYFSGFLLEDSLFIFVLKEGCIDLSICKSILEINRDAIKLLNFSSTEEKKEEAENKNIESDDIYDSLSKLNNELINTQRQLKKKQKELETLNKKLKLKTITDELTGLYNRRYFWQKIEEELARADRLDYSVAIVSIDINDFKKVNDTLGHDEGDRLLRDFSELTSKLMRKSFDFAFRWGGDEFVLVLNNCKKEQAVNIIDRLNKEFKKKSDIASLSYGIVIVEHSDDIDIEQVLKEADQKMYRDKASNKRADKSD